MLHAPEGGNNRIELLFGTTLFDVRDRRELGSGEVLEMDGLRLLTPASAAVRVSAAFFRAHPVEAEVLLSTVRDASQLLVPLLDGGRSVVAGRLAGADRRPVRRNRGGDLSLCDSARLPARTYVIRPASEPKRM